MDMQAERDATVRGSVNHHLEDLTESRRSEYRDKAVRRDIAHSNWSNLQLVRLVAKGKKFKDIDFTGTTFDACYLRDCQFDSCNFTGVRFASTNLHGSKFTGCMFEYATFERTIIDDTILADNCPTYENQKMRFARSLRVNYQQLGYSDAVNRAIRVELDATNTHLWKSWASNDRYYRTKYKGAYIRLRQFGSWLLFRLLDFIWGNGESVFALLRTVMIVVLAIVIADYAADPASSLQPMLYLMRAPQVFFGVAVPKHFSTGWITVITALRLVFFGLFMAILTKRFSRR